MFFFPNREAARQFATRRGVKHIDNGTGSNAGRRWAVSIFG